MNRDEIERIEDAFDRTTKYFANASASMRALGRALGDLGVALAPLARHPFDPPTPPVPRVHRLVPPDPDRLEVGVACGVYFEPVTVTTIGDRVTCPGCLSGVTKDAGGSSEPGGDR